MKYATVKYCCTICARLDTIQYRPTPAGRVNVNKIDMIGIISIIDLLIDAAGFASAAAPDVGDGCGVFCGVILLSIHEVRPDSAGISKSGQRRPQLRADLSDQKRIERPPYLARVPRKVESKKVKVDDPVGKALYRRIRGKITQCNLKVICEPSIVEVKNPAGATAERSELFATTCCKLITALIFSGALKLIRSMYDSGF